MKFIVTGGGTGGHIYPALAIAQGIIDQIPGSEVLYVGGKHSMEKELAEKAGFPFYEIEVAPLPHKLSLRTIKNANIAAQAVRKAKKLVKAYQPDCVIGTGGYVCGPMVLAAHLCGVATMIHEQNAVPGKTNKLLGRFVDCVCLGFPHTENYFPKPEKCIYTGLPVRKEILSQDKIEAKKLLQLSMERPILLITGGSQGAHAINTAVKELYGTFLQQGIEVIHVTGKRDYEDICAFAKQKGYGENKYLHLLPYGYHMEHYLAAGDFVIGRAGASFLAEITAIGLPSILIPYPYAVYNHQEANAQVVAQENGAVLLLEKELTAEKLAKETLAILKDKEKLAEMGKCAWACGNRHAIQDILQQIQLLLKK